MNLTPKVSVIIPLFNRVDLIGQTIVSITQQTYSNWEAIVVDDGSTDGSLEFVNKLSLADSRIKVCQREQMPKGAPVCRNIGASMATGEFLIFLDSDDQLAPFCFQQRVSSFQKFPQYDFLVFPMFLFKNSPGDNNHLWNIETSEDDLSRFLRWDSVWQTTCPIFKRAYFLETKGFDETLFFWQDYEFHVRILIEGAIYKKLFNVKPDCFYKQHEKDTLSQKSSTTPNRLLLMQGVVKQFIEQLKTKNIENPKYALNISAMIFWFSIKWIEQFDSLKKGAQLWRNCYQESLIGTPIFVLGKVCLILKKLQNQSTVAHLLLKPFYKIAILQLPKIYRVNNTTMHTIEYE